MPANIGKRKFFTSNNTLKNMRGLVTILVKFVVVSLTI